MGWGVVGWVGWVGRGRSEVLGCIRQLTLRVLPRTTSRALLSSVCGRDNRETFIRRIFLQRSL